MVYDPAKKVIANIHSGWRGSINNIIEKTILTMNTRFDCNPKDMIAGIGPSLGPCCGEFLNYRTEIPEKYHKYMTGSCMFDFWAMSTDQLVEAGLKLENIESSGLCTRCQDELFYSYRRAMAGSPTENKSTGRMATVITIL